MLGRAAISFVDDYTLRLAPVETDGIPIEAVYVRHFRDVYRYVLGLTQSHEEAEDVTAETFERALRAWNSPRGLPRSPLAWLLLTARRISTDRWRRTKRLASLRPAVRVIDVGGDERRAEFWLWFQALTAVLSDRQREVLLLRYQRDLTDEDIAMVMGLSASGVRSLVARALNALRSHPELL